MRLYKYQICEKNWYISFKKRKNITDIFHAGGKAPSDVSIIANTLGYKSLYIHRFVGNNLVCKVLTKMAYFDWLKILLFVKKKSILLIQFPIRWGNASIRYYILKTLCSLKCIKIIGLLHDIEPLRHNFFNETELSKSKKDQIVEFNLTLKVCDYLIVHNYKMKEYIQKFNYPSERLIELEIFDYLADIKKTNSIFTKQIVFAGNLSSEKSPFLFKLGKLQTCVELFGINYSDELKLNKNILYYGSYEADVLPQKINSGFGLIWDGDDINSCSGNTGNYLKWNNPHKLSLYLCSGIPVFIWKEAAEAKFVLDNNLGFAISNMLEIDEILSSIDSIYYESLVKNVLLISEKIRNGFYTKKALLEIEQKIQKKE